MDCRGIRHSDLRSQEMGCFAYVRLRVQGLQSRGDVEEPNIITSSRCLLDAVLLLKKLPHKCEQTCYMQEALSVVLLTRL